MPTAASEPGAPGHPASGSTSANAPTSASSPSATRADAPGSTLTNVNTKEDAHWVQADDYFVASRAFEKGWLSVHLGKMKEPPGSKGDALFFIVKDGSDDRSAHFYRTRPAVRSDLVLGNLLICFDDNKNGNVYRAPRDKDNARPGGWWLARITDLSDLEKGYATLAGHYHCAPDALRAIVK